MKLPRPDEGTPWPDFSQEDENSAELDGFDVASAAALLFLVGAVVSYIIVSIVLRLGWLK